MEVPPFTADAGHWHADARCGNRGAAVLLFLWRFRRSGEAGLGMVQAILAASVQAVRVFDVLPQFLFPAVRRPGVPCEVRAGLCCLPVAL